MRCTWQGRVGNFHRHLGDAEHAEIVIGHGTYCTRVSNRSVKASNDRPIGRLGCVGEAIDPAVRNNVRY
jgi:hypothetical protein